MKAAGAALLFLLIFALPFEHAVACTTFCFKDGGEWIYGRNYDWYTDACLIMVNKRGMVKTALTRDNPAQWISKYGSITFNQYGREFPLGGMNEAGLIIEIMWLDQTEYPAPDLRNGLSDLQWVQYQLDNFSTVEEVIASDSAVRITSRGSAPLHFLACDRTGKAAAIEFLEGEMVVHTGEGLPATALANSTYDSSLRFYEALHIDGTGRMPASADNSLRRFAGAALGVDNWTAEDSAGAIDHGLAVLMQVSTPMTMFSIVYDPANARIYYHTQMNPNVRYIDCGHFDFSCGSPVKVLDMHSGKAGDATGLFVDYTYDANRALIDRAYSESEPLGDVPASVRERVARYPESLRCQE